MVMTLETTDMLDLIKVAGSFQNYADSLFQKAAGVPSGQYRVLMAVDNGTQPVIETDIRKVTGRGLNSVSMLIDRMVISGLILRDRSLEDRRKAIITLTDKGKDTLQKGRECWQYINGVLDPGHRQMLDECLLTINEKIG
jgi:DNA-binding MarR family transcriptional regulator